MKGEEDLSYEEECGNGVVPVQMLAEVGGDKDAENYQRDDFLDHLQLHGAEAVSANAVGRHLEAVLEESNAPTDEDDLPQRFLTEAQVAVLGKGHEGVGDGEKNDGPHVKLNADGWSRVAELIQVEGRSEVRTGTQ
jgi:hypothetical protein